MSLNMSAWAPLPLEFSANPQNSSGGWLLLQSVGFCVARMESSGSLPCHPKRLGLTTSWEFGEKKFGFFSRKQFSSTVHKPLLAFSLLLFGWAALMVWVLHSRSRTLPSFPCLGKLDHIRRAPCPPPTTQKLV